MTEPRVLGGRYELGGVLGFGGMAEVLRGRDTRLGRDVAVKILRPDLARDPAFQARFRREAQSAASLNHPSIVAVYDTGEDLENGLNVPYIVMEYVEGRTLRDVIAREGRLLPQRALEITAEVCGALEYSHRASIVHRDIKPANVMLTRDGAIKVMDFGIARALTAAAATMTQTATVMGTAQYLSPEQARGETVDSRSDIYSCGCLLYELLTGTPPFTGDSPVAVAYQHVREDAPPPSRIDADIEPAVDAIVMKSLAKNPANRYQTATEMREDIDRALAGRPVVATPVLADPTMAIPATASTMIVPPPEQVGRRGRRALVYVLLTLAVLGVAFGVALFLGKSLGGSGGKVAVPSLTGSTEDQARQAVAGKGLKLTVKTDQSDHTPNVVYNQDPPPGTSLPKNSAVTVYISQGLAQLQVPQLVNLSVDDAKNALTGQGLTPGTVTQQDSPQAAGTVLSSDPGAGSTVDAGSKVNLVVASGQVTVPSVKGKDLAIALEELSAAGLAGGEVTYTQSDTAKPNSVVDQDPSGGTAPVGTKVRLVVAQAPTSTPTPPPPTTSAPPTTPPPTSASASPTKTKKP